MIQEISKDSHRKVCKGCHEIGHHRSDVNCKLKIEQKNRLKHKIKNICYHKIVYPEKQPMNILLN